MNRILYAYEEFHILTQGLFAILFGCFEEYLCSIDSH